jgi:hypothetical protein
MSTDPQSFTDESSEIARRPETAIAKEGADSLSETSEAVVAPSGPSPSEAPLSFLRLKSYCDERGMKSAIDLSEPFEHVSIEFRNGRTSRTVYIASEEDAETLLKLPIEDLVFLGQYSAICSYKDGWIEAAVRAHGAGRTSIARSKIFGISTPTTKETGEVEISGIGDVTLRLTEKRGILSRLDYYSPMYLRIEGIGITEHDKAVNLLEDLSNSLFMQIDFRFDSPLTLGRDRFSLRRLSKPRGQLDEDSQLAFPRFSYEQNPSTLYWYARSASSMPLLQFLAFYQCIEFFFPRYSRQEAIAKIKNALKDPAFDGNKDSCIDSILNATLDDRRGSLPEERKQLGATLKHCVDPVALRDFINETDERKRYYSNDYKKISEKRITLTDEAALVELTAERIYDIRCKVVHTKNADGRERDEMILPFSKEAELLMDDVELVRFLARKVLIASSVPLKF